MLEELEADYNVDENRVYLSGQSAGCSFTHAVGRNLALSESFTALGCTSGGGSSSDTSGEVLPIFQLWGEFDFWPYDLSSSSTSYVRTP